jgi:hypothetical protein
MSNINTMVATGYAHAVELILTLWEAGQTPYLLGRPGEGKSAALLEAARIRGCDEVNVLELTQMDPVGLAGYDFPAKPGENDGFAIVNKPHWFPRRENSCTILDDYADAQRAVRAAAYPLLHADVRRVGPHVLPAGAVVGCASNRTEDRALAGQLGTAEVGRVVFIQFEQNAKDFIESYAVNVFSPQTCAFLLMRPELFNTFNQMDDSNATNKALAYASARSWQASDCIFKVTGASENLARLLPGAIGPGPAAEYMTFLRVEKEIVPAQMIIADPTGVSVPVDPSARWLTVTLLVREAILENWDAIVTYAERLPPEFAAVLMRSAVTTNPELKETVAYITWAAENDPRL